MMLLDCLRICGPIIFLIDLGLKYSYGEASKFINQEMYTLYYQFLFARPILIVLYHAYRMLTLVIQLCLNLKRGFKKV